MARMSVTQFRQRFGRVPDEIKRRLGPGANKVRKQLRKQVIADMRRTTVGSALWGRSMKQPGVPRLLVRSVGFRFSRTEGGWISGVRLLGMAALIEMGAKTEAHLIRPYTHDRLYFEGSGGLVAPVVVRHPGARLKKDAVLDKNLRKAFPLLQREVARALDESFRRSFGL